MKSLSRWSVGVRNRTTFMEKGDIRQTMRKVAKGREGILQRDFRADRPELQAYEVPSEILERAFGG